MEGNISEDIKKWREKADLTQDQLADLLKINRKTIGEWESGESRPNKTNRKKLSDIFRANVTSKGITKGSNTMKIQSEPPDTTNEEWFKKTIETLIQTKGEYVNIHREAWEELKAGKENLLRNIDDLRKNLDDLRKHGLDQAKFIEVKEEMDAMEELIKEQDRLLATYRQALEKFEDKVTKENQASVK